MEAITNMRIISKSAGSRGRPKQHSAVLQMSTYRKHAGTFLLVLCQPLYFSPTADSCLSMGIHYEEFPSKTNHSGAPSCAMYQTTDQEDGWMRDKSGEGMMNGNLIIYYCAYLFRCMMLISVPRCYVQELLEHSRPVMWMSEEEKMAARLWSGLRKLPNFAAQIPRRPVKG